MPPNTAGMHLHKPSLRMVKLLPVLDGSAAAAAVRQAWLCDPMLLRLLGAGMQAACTAQHNAVPAPEYVPLPPPPRPPLSHPCILSESTCRFDLLQWNPDSLSVCMKEARVRPVSLPVMTSQQVPLAAASTSNAAARAAPPHLTPAGRNSPH
jgi:hypothetical protein